MSENTYPICIPDKAEPKSRYLAGQTATTVGYGPNTKGSATLNEFWSTIRAKRYCASKYDTCVLGPTQNVYL